MSHSERKSDRDWASDAPKEEKQGVADFDSTRFQRVGAAAVVSLSEAKYESPVKAISRNGRPLA